jgi:serine-type D-Ala-D-Ala carboxypeptidase (penicillin-binding protein 5/6)
MRNTNSIHIFILAVIFLLIIGVSRLIFSKDRANVAGVATQTGTAEVQGTAASPSVSFQRDTAAGTAVDGSEFHRDWKVLDPPIGAQAVLIQSLESSFPFLNYHTYATWPMASLTKLITAIVVLEDIGENQKVAIHETAVATEGEAGGLTSGEVYIARDLLKILLLTSSNDAATAFEEYSGGREAFVRLMTEKIETLGLAQTIVHDASGLSSLNESSASDLLKLARYIIEKDPEILEWTRLQSFLVQPLNVANSRLITNINPFVADRDFLGGKTGTSYDAKENLLATFSFGNSRIVLIVLGSTDRVTEVRSLLEWVKRAYATD